MPIYIDLPEIHERLLHEFAEEEMRPYRQQAAYMLCLALEHAAKVRDHARERELEEYPAEEPDQAPCPEVAHE